MGFCGCEDSCKIFCSISYQFKCLQMRNVLRWRGALVCTYFLKFIGIFQNFTQYLIYLYEKYCAFGGGI